MQLLSYFAMLKQKKVKKKAFFQATHLLRELQSTHQRFQQFDL